MELSKEEKEVIFEIARRNGCDVGGDLLSIVVVINAGYANILPIKDSSGGCDSCEACDDHTPEKDADEDDDVVGVCLCVTCNEQTPEDCKCGSCNNGCDGDCDMMSSSRMKYDKIAKSIKTNMDAGRVTVVKDDAATGCYCPECTQETCDMETTAKCKCYCDTCDVQEGCDREPKNYNQDCSIYRMAYLKTDTIAPIERCHCDACTDQCKTCTADEGTFAEKCDAISSTCECFCNNCEMQESCQRRLECMVANYHDEHRND